LRVLNAGSLNIAGPIAGMLNAQRPFIYAMSLSQNGNGIDLSMRVKTAAELGLNGRSASAYAGVLGLLAADPTLGAAFTNISQGNVFTRAYADVLPGPNTDVSEVLAADQTAAFGATARRLDLVSDKPEAPGGAWLQEFGVYHAAGNDSASLGVSGGGFGVAG